MRDSKIKRGFIHLLILAFVAQVQLLMAMPCAHGPAEPMNHSVQHDMMDHAQHGDVLLPAQTLADQSCCDEHQCDMSGCAVLVLSSELTGWLEKTDPVTPDYSSAALRSSSQTLFRPPISR